MSTNPRLRDLSRGTGPLAHLSPADQVPLPPPFDVPRAIRPLAADRREKLVVLDDTIAVGVPTPATKEEDRLVQGFLSGLRKLFSASDNWTFLKPLVLSMEYCAKCGTCSSACHVYQESGRNPLYRPTYRSEAFRRLYFKYVKHGFTWARGDIDLTWQTVAGLIELSYRCNLCRRCGQSCPMGVDNAMIAREIRKLASQELVCAPCSNCKGQIRDMLAYHDAWERAGITYGGLVELMVNALSGVKPGFIDWEWH